MEVRKSFEDFIHQLQDEICAAFQSLDPAAHFSEDRWQRPEGGGGITRIFENGECFEKGGVNTSVVFGKVPEPLQKNNIGPEDTFFACGISLVMHPLNPMVPTVHANFRYFELYDKQGERKDGWFGGGADLTPYYIFEEDAIHFHKVLKMACDQHNAAYYPRFKKWCDDYFYLAHRQEARGIGGLFFDYLKPDTQTTLEELYQFVTAAGRSFLPAYLPIVERRKYLVYNEQQREWQLIRRGRYVEFNLVYDRGTHFGLKSNGRVESILMSLPPIVKWKYNFTPTPGSDEEKLLQALKPRNWAELEPLKR